ISAAMLAGQQHGFDDPFSGSQGWRKRYGETEVSQFRSAEMIARHWDLTREAMEEYAYHSHQRAATAIDEGRFENEITPVGEFRTDETPRRNTTMAKMATLEPLSEGSPLTAAVASQISDAASATLVASEQFVTEHKLTPRAKIHQLTVAAADPVWMLTGPIPATSRALRKTGLSVGDIDRFEVNEAFASVVMAWLDETGADPERVN